MTIHRASVGQAPLLACCTHRTAYAKNHLRYRTVHFKVCIPTIFSAPSPRCSWYRSTWLGEELVTRDSRRRGKLSKALAYTFMLPCRDKLRSTHDRTTHNRVTFLWCDLNDAQRLLALEHQSCTSASFQYLRCKSSV